MRSALLALALFALVALAACGRSAQPTATPAPAAEGQRLYTIWCSGCHAVAADAPAGIGPSLAGVATVAAANAEGLDATAWLRREILEPDAVITPGYKPRLMPATYGQNLSAAQVDALVAYLLTLE